MKRVDCNTEFEFNMHFLLDRHKRKINIYNLTINGTYGNKINKVSNNLTLSCQNKFWVQTDKHEDINYRI